MANLEKKHAEEKLELEENLKKEYEQKLSETEATVQCDTVVRQSVTKESPKENEKGKQDIHPCDLLSERIYVHWKIDFLF